MSWRVAIGIGHSGGFIYGHAEDISPGGMSILCDEQLAGGKQFSIFVEMPPYAVSENSAYLEALCKVNYSVLVASRNLYRIGLEFVELKDEGKDILRKYIASQTTAHLKDHAD